MQFVLCNTMMLVIAFNGSTEAITRPSNCGLAACLCAHLADAISQWRVDVLASDAPSFQVHPDAELYLPSLIERVAEASAQGVVADEEAPPEEAPPDEEQPEDTASPPERPGARKRPAAAIGRNRRSGALLKRPRRALPSPERAWLSQAFEVVAPLGGRIAAPDLDRIRQVGLEAEPPKLSGAATPGRVRSWQRTWREHKKRSLLQEQQAALGGGDA